MSDLVQAEHRRLMPNERLVIRYELSGRVSEVNRMRNKNRGEYEHCLRMFVSLPAKIRGFYSAGISRGSGQAVLIEGLSRARDAKSASIGGGESQSSGVCAPFQGNLTGIDACCSRDMVRVMAPFLRVYQENV